MWLLILAPLPFKDLCNLSLISKSFHKLSNNEWLWRRKVLVDFEIDDILSVILGNSVDKTFEDLKQIVARNRSSWKIIYSRIYQAKSKAHDFSTKISKPCDGWGIGLDDVFSNTIKSSKFESIFDFRMNEAPASPPIEVNNFKFADQMMDSWPLTIPLLRGRLTLERDLANKIPTVTALRSLKCKGCSSEIQTDNLLPSYQSRLLYRGFSDVSSTQSYSALKICTCASSMNSVSSVTSPKYAGNFLDLLSFVSIKDPMLSPATSVVVSDTLRSRATSPTPSMPVVEFINIPTRRNQSLPTNGLSPFGSAPSRTYHRQ